MDRECPTCHNEGVVERAATPEEVDNGCELGIAIDPCPNEAWHHRSGGQEVCSECGLPLPAPHRGTCSMSLMNGGPGYGQVGGEGTATERNG